MKRILSLLIAVSVIFSLMVIPSRVSAEDDSLNENIGLLLALGIYEGDKAEAGHQVTRGEFSVMLGNIIQANIPVEKPIFSDVPANHYAASSIYMLHKMGLLKGKEGGAFAPEEIITVDDAMVILTRFLGYEELAEAKGGYISGYYSVAKSISLLSGVAYTSGAPLTLAVFSTLVENLLETEIFSIISVSGNGDFSKNTVPGNTVAKLYYNLEIEENVVYGNEYTTLSNPEGINAGLLRIGGRILETDLPDANDYLGYMVKVYYNAEAGNAVYLRKTEKNSSVTFTHRDIDRYEDFKLYFKDSIKYEKIPASASIIYNRYAIETFDKSLFDIDKGTIELIDNNGDNIFDVVKILNYKNYVTDTASSNQNLIILKDNKGSLDLNNDYEKFTVTDINGNLRDVGMINKDYVLTVLDNPSGKYIEIVYTNEAIQGRLESYSFSDEESYLYINDTQYVASDYFIENFGNIKSGEAGVFFLDIFGEVVSYLPLSETNSGFGYVVAAALEDPYDDAFLIKMMTEADSTMRVFTTKNKITIDGEYVPAVNALERLKNMGRDVVYYELDSEGLIAFIDTLEPDSGSPEEELKLIYDSWNTLETYRESSLAIDTSSATEYIWMSDNCTIFSVPDNTSSNESDFDVYKPDSLSNSASYKYKAYQRNKEGILADLILMPATESDDTVSYSPYAYIRVIESVSQVVSPATGEITNKIKYWTRGTASECYSLEPEIGAELNPGDCVYMSLNAKNEMYHYQYLFNNKDKQLQQDVRNRPGAHRFLYGNVYDSYESIYRITAGEPSEAAEDATLLEPHRYARFVYVVTELPSGKVQISAGTGREMQGYINTTNYSKVFIHEAYLDDMDLVIYEKR